MARTSFTHKRALQLVKTAESLKSPSEVVQTGRLLALCSLPRRKFEGQEFVRDIRLGSDGNPGAWMRVTYGSRDGTLAYGGDRVLLTAALHLALESDSPAVEFTSMSQLLSSLDLPTGGTQYKRLRESAERLRSTYLRITEAPTREGLDRESRGAQTFLFESWSFDSDPVRELGETTTTQTSLFSDEPATPRPEVKPYLRIGETLWKELQQQKKRLLAPLPLLRLYTSHPLAWDYCWFLIHRCCAARRPTRIPHEALVELFADDRSAPRNTLSRLQTIHREIEVATDGRLKAKWVEAAPGPSSGGRPKKRWALEIEPSETLILPR